VIENRALRVAQHHVAVDVVRGAFCKAAASTELSCLTMRAIERS
jgi:hypothetical protein